jgi:hypothetical protein
VPPQLESSANRGRCEFGLNLCCRGETNDQKARSIASVPPDPPAVWCAERQDPAICGVLFFWGDHSPATRPTGASARGKFQGPALTGSLNQCLIDASCF